MVSPASAGWLGAPEDSPAPDVVVLIVVAHDRRALYEQFVDAFRTIERVEVILDRRLASSHMSDVLPSGDACRRWEPDVYDELLLRGFVIRRVPRVAARR